MDVKEESQFILNILEKVEFFQGFAEDELWRLLESGDWSKAAPGEKIVTAGELDLHMYVLINGQAEVVFGHKVMAVLEGGDTFGEFGLMGERRSADVVSKTPCLLLKFNADRLNQLPVPLQVKLLKRILFSLMVRLQSVNRHFFWNLPTHWKR
ncbi:MAG: cyclic nucleotide-binding domain-containing protein [Thermodesulfobacteriota bacterium]